MSCTLTKIEPKRWLLHTDGKSYTYQHGIQGPLLRWALPYEVKFYGCLKFIALNCKYNAKSHNLL